MIKYLNILNTEVSNIKISENITVGCMTLKSKGSLKIRLKSNKVDFKKLELNGFAEVEKILIQRLAWLIFTMIIIKKSNIL